MIKERLRLEKNGGKCTYRDFVEGVLPGGADAGICDAMENLSQSAGQMVRYHFRCTASEFGLFVQVRHNQRHMSCFSKECPHIFEIQIAVCAAIFIVNNNINKSDIQ